MGSDRKHENALEALHGRRTEPICSNIRDVRGYLNAQYVYAYSVDDVVGNMQTTVKD